MLVPLGCGAKYLWDVVLIPLGCGDKYLWNVVLSTSGMGYLLVPLGWNGVLVAVGVGAVSKNGSSELTNGLWSL